jgi:hypothetical protein
MPSFKRTLGGFILKTSKNLFKKHLFEVFIIDVMRFKALLAINGHIKINNILGFPTRPTA